jgi:hypothetical protein
LNEGNNSDVARRFLVDGVRRFVSRSARHQGEVARNHSLGYLAATRIVAANRQGLSGKLLEGRYRRPPSLQAFLSQVQFEVRGLQPSPK